MDKNSMICMSGDCPGLDHSPKSREHEARFNKQSKAESQMVKNNSAVMINGVSAQNHSK